ncbi:HSP20 family molecular chaperone IbpA/uncharacterized membrane protein HdeD (DUF308 family) [Paraburkholderia sp. GAS448]|uniref:Hsp20 family protein n=1 Tax=Paraburkholderia sp. GAS448 TaxID=3035136 RepID=UPI003D25DFD4
MHDLLGHAWWMLALALSGLMIAFLVALYVAYATISGISAISGAIRHGHDRWGWWAPQLLGLFSVVAGVIAIFLPAVTALVLVIVRRVNAIAAGVFDLVTVTRSRGRLRRARSLYATGTISLVFGVLVIAWPGAGALALVWMIGAYAIFSGALLHLLTDLIRDPFGGLGRWNSGSAISIPAGFSRAFDVVDDGDALRILAELPGLSRDDVKLEVINDMLVLSGNKQIESKGEEKGCYRVERAFGQFQRAIPLRSGVDLDRVDTRFDNGVLTIRVPKAGETKQTAKQIEIR